MFQGINGSNFNPQASSKPTSKLEQGQKQKFKEPISFKFSSSSGNVDNKHDLGKLMKIEEEVDLAKAVAEAEDNVPAQKFTWTDADGIIHNQRIPGQTEVQKAEAYAEAVAEAHAPAEAVAEAVAEAAANVPAQKSSWTDADGIKHTQETPPYDGTK